MDIEKKLLTIDELIGLTSANFYLSSLAPRAFRRAARKFREQGRKELCNLFIDHAVDETGHHYWAWDDLKAMDVDLLPITYATERLINWMEEVISSDEPWKLLALSNVAERLAPSIEHDLKDIIPENGSATYITKHVVADSHHQGEIDKILDLLEEDERKSIDELTPFVKKLYFDHILEGIESGKHKPMKGFLSRRSNKLYLLTEKPPVEENVSTSRIKDLYTEPGDGIGINNLCRGAVGKLGWDMKMMESKPVTIYLLPDEDSE